VISVDATTGELSWHVDDAEAAKRRAEFEGKGQRPLRVKRGVLLRYARDVQVSPLFFLSYGLIGADKALSAGECWGVLRLRTRMMTDDCHCCTSSELYRYQNPNAHRLRNAMTG